MELLALTGLFLVALWSENEMKPMSDPPSGACPRMVKFPDVSISVLLSQFQRTIWRANDQVYRLGRTLDSSKAVRIEF